MAFNETLADRISAALKDYKGVESKRMFGGIAFMLNGHMCCGVIKDDMMAKVDPERYPALLKKPGARPMDFTGRVMSTFIFVDAKGQGKAAGLKFWVEEAARYAMSRPTKTRTAKRSASKPRLNARRKPRR
ncbi:MAG: methyltransferase TrmH, group 3 [Fibrobacteres bacterium]|nr:methyltransferase TrmH, group 3 [Fibrobacterota bacterium]